MVRENSNSFNTGASYNGSTRGFGSLSTGSTPVVPTKIIKIICLSLNSFFLFLN